MKLITSKANEIKQKIAAQLEEYFSMNWFSYMKTTINFIFLLIIVLLVSCRKYHTILYIHNNSDKDIYWMDSNLYPDTAIDNSVYLTPGSTRTPSEIVHPGETRTAIARSVSPADIYFANNIPSGIIEVFILDANVVKTTPWDTVVNKYLVLKRYDLSLDSLEKMNITVTFQ